MLKGHKVHLRILEKTDIGILYELSNEEKVKRYNIITDDTRNSNKINLRKALSIFNEKNALIGFVTYKESDYCKRVYCIGITIGSCYWGREYGKDAINTLLKYLFRDLNAVRVELEVIKSNLRAINCYKKCGFIEERVKRNKIYIDGEYVDTLIMGIIREEISDI